MVSLLEKLDASDIEMEPFPHIMARNVVDRDLLQRLIAEFPDFRQFSDFTETDNTRLTLYRAQASGSDIVSPLWREFLETNSDREHLLHFARIFGDAFKHCHPHASVFIDKIEALSVGLKSRDTFQECQLLLNAAMDVNTPIRGAASSVRGPHVDSVKKAWVALFYLRDEDESVGGDLELYRLKPGHSLAGNVFDGSHIRSDCLELVKTVPYEANTLFIAVNSAHAIHGVSPRQPTPHARKFMTFNCDLPNRLF